MKKFKVLSCLKKYLFNNSFSNVFSDLLFGCVVCHLRYTFPMSIWVDKFISYIRKQNKNKNNNVLLCMLVVDYLKLIFYNLS